MIGKRFAEPSLGSSLELNSALNASCDFCSTIILWMISSAKIDTPYVFLLATAIFGGLLPFASFTLFLWMISLQKNNSLLGTLPSLRTPSVEVTNEHMTLSQKSYSL